MGLDNKIFKMLKFRTMKVQSKDVSDTTWTTNDDPRKTRFGNFLRKTNLDELPQFINVFLGQMSVVGPRPERPHFVKKFKKDIPEYMLRHKVKAGITGWAQINGFRGDTSIKKRVDADLWYIENWTLGLDLKIVILTLFRGFFDKNAY
jgi:lipopolysaccharide/colanic/teichoic acid biosynthesis glycosyltransferase